MPSESIEARKTAHLSWMGNDSDPKEVWIVLHGYGQLSNYFLKTFDAFKHQDRLIIAPEGLHRFYRSGLSGRVGASWMTEEARDQDIADYLNWLDQVAQKFSGLIQQAEKLMLFGFSQGAATAARWGCHSSLSFTDVVLWAAAFPPDVSIPSLTSTSRLHLCLGDQDELHQTGLAPNMDQIDTASISISSYQGGHEVPFTALKEWLIRFGYLV